MDWSKTPSDTRNSWFAWKVKAGKQHYKKAIYLRSVVQLPTGQGICLRDWSAVHLSAHINLHSEKNRSLFRQLRFADAICNKRKLLAQGRIHQIHNPELLKTWRCFPEGITIFSSTHLKSFPDISTLWKRISRVIHVSLMFLFISEEWKLSKLRGVRPWSL